MCTENTQLERLIRNDLLWELWKVRDLSVKYLADRTFDGSVNGNGLEFKEGWIWEGGVQDKLGEGSGRLSLECGKIDRGKL